MKHRVEYVLAGSNVGLEQRETRREETGTGFGGKS